MVTVSSDALDLQSRMKLVQRVSDEFREIPGLCLTGSQASRFFGLPEDLCEQILTCLVENQVLQKFGDYYGDLRQEFIGSHFATRPIHRSHQ